tara:strand:+ start:159 stop:845 length:687 start_codon:yes stop_codon:yes gene_type:complete
MNPKTPKLSDFSSPLPVVNGPNHFDLLPNELKRAIFLLIFPGDPFKVGRFLSSVCREWRWFSKHHLVLPSFSMQMNLHKKYYPLPAYAKYRMHKPKLLGSVLSCFKNINFLDLGGINFLLFERLEIILKACPNVYELRFDMFDLKDEHVAELDKLCPHLKKLELWDIQDLTQDGVLALMNFKNMVELSFALSFDLKPLEILRAFSELVGNNNTSLNWIGSKFSYKIKK